MNIQYRFKSPWPKSVARAGGVATALFFLGAAPAVAQMTSTAQLKVACETSLDNVVRIDQGVKITQGVRPEAGAEWVMTGCTLDLGPSGQFETDQVSMAFNGPFNVRSVGQAKAVFVKSRWEATAMSFDLSAGPKGEVKVVTSEVRTTLGDFVVKVAVEGQFQAQYLLGTALDAIDAAGAVSITGGDKFLVQVSATGIQAADGIRFELAGRDSVLKSEFASFLTSGGPVVITSASAKNLVEMKRVTLEPQGGSARVALVGSESTLKMVEVHVASELGNVELRTGGPLAPLGLVEIVDSNVRAPRGSLTVVGSFEDIKGVVKAAKSTFTAGSDLVLATGSSGVTEVKENNLTAGNALRILTGVGGNCIAELNIVSAPMREICPPR